MHVVALDETWSRTLTSSKSWWISFSNLPRPVTANSAITTVERHSSKSTLDSQTTINVCTYCVIIGIPHHKHKTYTATDKLPLVMQLSINQNAFMICYIMSCVANETEVHMTMGEPISIMWYILTTYSILCDVDGYIWMSSQVETPTNNLCTWWHMHAMLCVCISVHG